MQILGLDIGGSGIKGAPVDTVTGQLLADRFRVKTPKPATPKEVAECVREVVDHFVWRGPVGCGFPAVIKDGVAHTAANVDKAWIGTNARDLFQEKANCDFYIANDGDVAGLAEIRFGAGKGNDGLIIVLTLGTGIGSAIFYRGVLIPHSEIGHMEYDGKEAEEQAAESAKEREKLGWPEYGTRVNRYLEELHALFWPDLVILGGGGSKKFAKFREQLTVDMPVVQAELKNLAGIVGAALYAEAEIQHLTAVP